MSNKHAPMEDAAMVRTMRRIYEEWLTVGVPSVDRSGAPILDDEGNHVRRPPMPAEMKEIRLFMEKAGINLRDTSHKVSAQSVADRCRVQTLNLTAPQPSDMEDDGQGS